MRASTPQLPKSDTLKFHFFFFFFLAQTEQSSIAEM
jgi:hypothetical protein